VTESKIIHGSCLDMIPTLPGDIKAIVTDPPYGVKFRSRRAETANGKQYNVDIANDADLAGAIELFTDTMLALAPLMADECELYVFTRWDIVPEWMQAVRNLEPLGIVNKMMLVWDKGIPGMGDIDGNWGCGHEIILYAKRGRRQVPYRRSSIIAVDKPHPSKIIHPTEKPVPLLEKLIEMSTERGDLVVDPFSGSGSTIKAAQNLGRIGIGIEVDETYVKRSRQRLEEFSMF
jgi:site-specific DNA-methyltransferase (adenine-specific)